MGDGKPSPSAEAHLQRLSQAIFEGSPSELKDVAKFHHALDLLGTINDNRNERLDSSDGSVPGVLWLVLIGGGLITLVGARQLHFKLQSEIRARFERRDAFRLNWFSDL